MTTIIARPIKIWWKPLTWFKKRSDWVNITTCDVNYLKNGDKITVTQASGKKYYCIDKIDSAKEGGAK